MSLDALAESVMKDTNPKYAVLREALWEEGAGFVRRSRAEAALRLLDATHNLGWEPQMASIGRGPGWIADVFPNEDSNFHGTGPTAEDAHADAVKAALRAKIRMSTREIP